MVVESEAGFVVGDTILISSSGRFETRTIASFGSIVLDAPLIYSYPAGSTVVKTDSPLSDDESTGSASTLLVVGLIGGVVGAGLFLYTCRACWIWCSRWCRNRRLGGSKVAVFPAWGEAQGVVPAGCAQGAPAATAVVEIGIAAGAGEAIQWVPEAFRRAGGPGAAPPWPSCYAVGRR